MPPVNMTDSRLRRDYFFLSFVPSVLSSTSIRLGVLLTERGTFASEGRLRFAGVKFVENLQSLAEMGADEFLVDEAISEITAVVHRANATGGVDELDAVLQTLLNANSGLCAFEYSCEQVGDPNVELQALFDRLVNSSS